MTVAATKKPKPKPAAAKTTKPSKKLSLLDLAGILTDKEADELTAYASKMRGYQLNTK